MSGSDSLPPIQIYRHAHAATEAAANWLVNTFAEPATKNVMLAGGNTPLGLYATTALRRPNVGHINIFALDEYVGVPLDEPRNCANLIRKNVVEPWGINLDRYHWISSVESDAHESIRNHEEIIHATGGLDLVILGLGRNGHVGFNEPGSAADSIGRVVELDSVSTTANREWFAGRYAPARGVTTGMHLILASKQVLLLAFGTAKAPAVAAMLEGPASSECPASLLQRHPNVCYVLDEDAARNLHHY